MKAKVTRMECPRADWIRVVNAARRTANKKRITHEPKDSFKKQILLAEHSPIRLLEYDFTIEHVRQWVTVHLVRHHVGCEKFVSTQREDRNEEIETMVEAIMNALRDAQLLVEGWSNRDYMFQGAENTMDMTCNAQAFISISRVRLCSVASKETREVWKLVIEMLREVDPILASKCVPNCLYRGFCTERNSNPELDKCCGYVNTKEYQRRLEEYRTIE